MKFTLTLTLGILSIMAAAQDTTYYDASGNKVGSKGSIDHSEIRIRDHSDTNKVTQSVYYKAGQIKLERSYDPYHAKRLHGKLKAWYEDGQLKKDIDYEEGKLSGQILTYWPNGIPKRKDIYEAGVFIEGTIWDQEGNEIPHYAYEIMPEFPGGESKLIQFLGENIQYPPKAKKKGVEGRVVVNFIVEKDGSISKFRIIESVNKELDAEAIRLLKKMPKWESGKEDGEAVRVAYNLPIRFRMN